MKLYFVFFFILNLLSMYFALLFVCYAHHRPVWDLCGWLFLLTTLFRCQGETLSAASLNGNVRHFCFLYSHLFFLPWLLFGFIKQYGIVLFVRLMKTIHVNITSKKMYIFTTSELLLFHLQIKYSMTTQSVL